MKCSIAAYVNKNIRLNVLEFRYFKLRYVLKYWVNLKLLFYNHPKWLNKMINQKWQSITDYKYLIN